MKKEEWKRVLRLIEMHNADDARFARRYYREYFRRWGRGWDKVIVAERGNRIIGVSGYVYDNREAQGVYWLGFTGYQKPRPLGRGKMELVEKPKRGRSPLGFWKLRGTLYRRPRSPAPWGGEGAFTFIHPRYRGRGLGHQLLYYIQQDLKKRKARKLFLTTSSNVIYGGAVSFYTNHGFRWEGTLKDLYGPGGDQIIMGKDLTGRRRRAQRKRRTKKRRRIRR